MRIISILYCLFSLSLCIQADPNEKPIGECIHTRLAQRAKFNKIKPFYEYAKNSMHVLIIHNTEVIELKKTKQRKSVYRNKEIKIHHVLKGSFSNESSVKILLSGMGRGYFMVCLKENRLGSYDIVEGSLRELFYKPHIPKNKTLKETIKTIASAQAGHANYLYNIYMKDLK